MKLPSFLAFVLASTTAYGRTYTITYYKEGRCKGTGIACINLALGMYCPLPASIPETIGFYPLRASSDDGKKEEFLGVGLRRPDGTCGPCQDVALMEKCMLGGEGAYVVKSKVECKWPEGRKGKMDEGEGDVDEGEGNMDAVGCRAMREVDTLLVNGTTYELDEGTRDEVVKDAFEMDDELFLEKHARALVKRNMDVS